MHGQTGVGDTGEYLHPEDDRQVGLGMLGLANLLALEGVTYKELGDELEAMTYMRAPEKVTSKAGKIVLALSEGIINLYMMSLVQPRWTAHLPSPQLQAALQLC